MTMRGHRASSSRAAHNLVDCLCGKQIAHDKGAVSDHVAECHFFRVSTAAVVPSGGKMSNAQLHKYVVVNGRGEYS